MEDFESVLVATRCGGGRADDIAGAVWLATARAIHQFQGDEDGSRSWLSTVARRRVIGHRRRGARRRTDPVDPVLWALARWAS